MNQEDLWRSFPTTATAFEAMFPDEEACRRYLVEVRWGGRPRCGKMFAAESHCETASASRQTVVTGSSTSALPIRTSKHGAPLTSACSTGMHLSLSTGYRPER